MSEIEKQNICKNCNGTGISKPIFSDEVEKECWSCDGIGIKCSSQDEITCPYCGHKENDSWEYGQDSRNYQCGNCGKNSYLSVNISIDYSTSIIECLNDESKHDWKTIECYEPSNGKIYSRCRKCSEYKWVLIK